MPTRFLSFQNERGLTMKKTNFFLVLAFTFILTPPVSAQFGFRYTNLELRDLIRRDKLNMYLIPIMQEYNIDCWITLTRDPNDDMTNVIWDRKIQLDPIVEFIGGEDVKVPAAFIFTVSGERTAIAAEADAKYIRDTGLYKKVLTYTYDRLNGHSGFLDVLGKTVKELNPKSIGLNYSEEEGVADGLTLGMKNIFDKSVGPDLARRVVSAEKIIISLWNRKVPAEIQLIEKSARKSAEITDEALSKVVPGVTTARGIFNYIRARIKEEGMGPAWRESSCPGVSVGAFRVGAPPLDKVVERGDLIVINSGFLLEGHMSDLNKVAYVLKEGETEAPEHIKKIFAVGVKAIQAAVSKIKPGATGQEVDKAGRAVVTSSGCLDYGHATGHTTGLWVHGLGIILGPPWKSYGEKVNMKIHKDDIYAVELRATAYSEQQKANIGIHFQEMVIVEQNGARYLTPPVTELRLIK